MITDTIALRLLAVTLEAVMRQSTRTDSQPSNDSGYGELMTVVIEQEQLSRSVICPECDPYL